MKMLKKQLSILLIIFWLEDSSTLLLGLWDIAGWGFMGKLREIKGNRDALIAFKSVIFGATEENAEILEKLDSIHKNLEDFKAYTKDKLDKLELLISELPHESEIRVIKRMITSTIAGIDDKWHSFVGYTKNNVSFGRYNDFTLHIITNTEESLINMRHMITSQVKMSASDKGFFRLLKNLADAKMNIICDEGETYHHILVHALQLLLLTEIKAFILLHFSYHWRYSNSDGWETLLEPVTNNYKKQIKLYIHEFSNTLASSNLPFIRACDPGNGNWIRGETFFEIEKFLQQTIYKGSSCYDQHVCAREAWKANRSDRCAVQKLNQHTACDSDILNCTLFRSWTHKTKACAYSGGPYRIQWIKSHSKGPRGIAYPVCPSANLWVNKGYLWSTHNAFCNCQCYSPTWKVITEPIESILETNRVIVGMRLNVYEKFIYIQIAEGELESNGYISSYRWIYPEESLENPRYWETAKTVTLSESSFFFDDLQLPSGYVLSGISFDHQTRNGIAGFGLKIRGVPFNYETGKLDSNRKEDVTSQKHASNQELSFRSRSSIYMKPYEIHRIDSNGYTHLKLNQSEIYHDFGQSTLPLVDSTQILTSPLSPIGGVGLFHKGYRDYAGFLSLRLYPIE